MILKLSILFLLLIQSQCFADDKIDMINTLCHPKNEAMLFEGFQKCGDYYLGQPAATDFPAVMFDATGQKVAMCGGMPHPDGSQTGDQDPYCKIPCEDYSKMVPCTKIQNLYPIHELHGNLSKEDVYKTQGYIIYKYECPTCPPQALCKPCGVGNVVIGENFIDLPSKNFTYDFLKNPQYLVLYYDHSLESQLQVGQRHNFTLKALNTSGHSENQWTILSLDQ